MFDRIFSDAARGPAAGVRAAGYILIVLGVAGVVIGLMLIESLTADFRASIDVSRSALSSVGETVEVVEDVALATADSIESISQSATSAAFTTEAARDGLANVADFLDDRLPEDIEAIHRALPGAIGAADAVDTTLGALSLFGVDYSPTEPFGDSLRRVEDTLATLPEEIRAQSSSIQTLVPLADLLAEDVGELAVSLTELGMRLEDVRDLAGSYNRTIAEAEAALEGTDRSLDQTVLLLRIVVALSSIGAVTIGLALISIHRGLNRIAIGLSEMGANEKIPIG